MYNSSLRVDYGKAYIKALSSTRMDEIRGALLAIRNLGLTEALPQVKRLTRSRNIIWEIRLLAEKVSDYLESLREVVH